jgi:hypothetical protein
MPEMQRYGIICKCGVPIIAPHIEQAAPISIEQLRKRLKQQNWAQTIEHRNDLDLCTYRGQYVPDDVILLPW